MNEKSICKQRRKVKAMKHHHIFMKLGFSSNVAPDMVTSTDLGEDFSFSTEFKSC
jgi:hypothetical protein